MTEISMVSYYNPLSMYRQQQQAASTQQQLSQQAQQHVQAAHQHAAAAAAAAAHQQTNGQQYWYPGYSHHHHHHQSSGGPQQYLEPTDVIGWPPHPHAHHYSHLQYQHHQMAYQSHQQSSGQTQSSPQASQLNGVSDWSGDEANNNNGVGAGEPSPPITVSGSELSSPGTPSSPPANNNNMNAPNNNSSASTTPMRPAQIRSPYEWMKKPSYQNQPNPGKTRTKDKYRVVYTDHQRLELEKEFHYSRYITIRRKAELAANLSLSERQVKIWFQNRRAKERKQVKKREEMEQKDIKCENLTAGGMASLAALGSMSGMLGGLMHNSGSPPLGLGPPPHGLSLGHPGASLHAHQHPHSHGVLGL